ncbi:hypothetical protein TRSC58_03658 [Trypanosoma rangeli SC58]|uniref:Uncharacterized protein n=1 Tax=Trypanosoma rangeli SC58 TaxID=429131 RepID=A0A061J3G8_TRYRA|nr:hypothetical protein TRSC58_05794 [Trypanosoma rangeli SC58]ESL08636.1 hypothetical protein TRSC58_03658 [Trypanosoma rangeli SC58]
MWLFTGVRGGGSDGGGANQGAVPSLPNVADTQTVLLKRTKGEGHEEGALSPSLIDRSKSQQLVIRKGDARVAFFDTEAVDCIGKRYEKEMTVADQLMKKKQKKKQEQGPLCFYDYEEDRRYSQWLKDQEHVREILKVHWLDMIMDRPLLCLTYLARVGTTVGFFHGMGRAAYLYRTMDKIYIKLHGVSFAGIALCETSISIVKGALVAAAGTVGIVVGESVTSITRAIATNDVSVPERTWINVWVCGTSGGLFAGGAFAVLHASILTPWGMTAAVMGFTAASSLVGLALARITYHPFAAARQGRTYDPYWHPWYTRRLNDGGGAYMRGRYI